MTASGTRITASRTSRGQVVFLYFGSLPETTSAFSARRSFPPSTTPHAIPHTEVGTRVALPPFEVRHLRGAGIRACRVRIFGFFLDAPREAAHPGTRSGAAQAAARARRNLAPTRGRAGRARRGRPDHPAARLRGGHAVMQLPTPTSSSPVGRRRNSSGRGRSDISIGGTRKLLHAPERSPQQILVEDFAFPSGRCGTPPHTPCGSGFRQRSCRAACTSEGHRPRFGGTGRGRTPAGALAPHGGCTHRKSFNSKLN